MTDYPGQLLDILEGMHHSEPEQRLNSLLRDFEMWPDVRSAVEQLFWRRESLYRVVVDSVDAWPRVQANVRYALTHQGNLAANFSGYPRTGKSTVARFIAKATHQIQFGTTKGWHDKVLFSRSYSRATKALSELTRRLVDQGHDDATVLAALQGWFLIEDENQLEREKDSVKAKTDMMTIAESCASSGIHFFYLSPTRRGFGYFTIWVVGIDTRRQLNLSFYLDNDDVCHGILITPNIPAFDTYITTKNRVVVQTLVDRGRVQADVIDLSPATTTPTPEAVIVPPDAGFLKVLQARTIATFQGLTPKRSPRVIKRWVAYYFDGLTAPQIKDYLQETITVRGITKSIDELSTSVDTTTQGAILEAVLADYLNLHTLPRSKGTSAGKGSEGAPEPSESPILVSDLHLRWLALGGPGKPDVILVDRGTGRALAAIGCKFYWGRGQQNAWDGTPEHRACPEKSYLVVVERPEKTGASLTHWAARIPEGGWVKRGSLTNLGLKWEAFLEELREVVKAAGVESA